MKLIYLLLALNIAVAPVTDTATEADTERGCVKLPVFMYHRFLKHPTTEDPYTISPDALECDLKYLSENGYTAVGTGELLDFVENGVPLPPKPVVLTFDDGHYNNLYYAAPLLEKYGMKAIIFVVGRYSEQSVNDGDNPNYSYINWSKMETLSTDIEIQSHTWDMHKLSGVRTGIKRKRGETREEYENALRCDLIKLNEEIKLHTGKAPVAFALPFGAEEKWSEPVLDDLGLKISFCSRQGVSVITKGDIASLRNIKRIVRKPGKSVEWLLKKYY